MIQSAKTLEEGTNSELRSQRRANSRASRRGLANITPAASHPQRQSLLFSVLPSEIRNLIFMYTVCQDYNLSSTVYKGRPGHRHSTRIDTALLRTCRLIYYETRSIPPRSATHHINEPPSESFNPRNWDHYLFHLSSQIGRDLHHLHVTAWRQPFDFPLYFSAHLQWKKLTWTLCASERTPAEMSNDFDISETLLNTTFPDTCHEINIEYESLIDFPFQRILLRGYAEKCAEVGLTRQDGTSLNFNPPKSAEYTWEGEAFNGTLRRHFDAVYHVIRLCWRDKVPEREYMRYDRLDCLSSDAMHFMTRDEMLKDRENITRE